MKKIILSLGLLFSLSTVFSQSFMQGAGVAFFGVAPSSTLSGLLINESLTYSPRFNFFEAGKVSVSVGIPLSLGISEGTHDATYFNGYTNSTHTNTYFGLFINAPVYFNFNFGRGATKHNTNKFGFFAGAGYGFYTATYATDNNGSGVVTDDNSGTSTGLALDAGVRLGVGRKHVKRPKNIEIRMTYMNGSSDLIKSLYGLGCSFNF